MLYNLFARDPAPCKCSVQTRTICVNTKAERHVVARSGDTTIPLPFKKKGRSSALNPKRLADINRQKWHNEMNVNSHCESYQMFQG